MKACCENAPAGPTSLRINFCECILVAVAWVRRVYVEEELPRILGDRAVPSVRWPRADRDDGAHDARRLGGALA